jgi:hypothetical protein
MIDPRRLFYRVSGSKNEAEGTPDLLVEEMIGALSGHYSLVASSTKTYLPLACADLRDVTTYTNLTVRSSRRNQVEIDGHTDCLRTR